MTIHIPTLLVALLTGFLMLCVQLAFAQRGGLQHAALRIWARASWALLLGFALLGARVFLPIGVSVFAGNVLICLGLLLYNQALSVHLLQQRLSRWPWITLALGAGLILLMLPWTLAARTAVISLLFMALLLPSVALVLRHGWRAEPSLRTVGITLALSAGALSVRGLHAMLVPQDYETLLQSSLGQGLTFLVSFISLLGTGFGFVLACFERTARRMEEMATTDGMTACLNRSATDALLAHSLERGRRDGAPVAFALLDLDFFKQINDRHGHSAGDDVLRAFAEVARKRLRGSDVLGRMGGEEFGLILSATDAPGAQRLVDDIRGAVECLSLRSRDGQPIQLTVSAGIAVAASDSGLSADQLCARADRALYRAKDSGRNCVRIWQETGLATG